MKTKVTILNVDTSGKITFKKDIQQFLSDYKQKLYELFAERNDENELLTTPGLPPYLLREVLQCSPLFPFIPEEYTGRGRIVSEAPYMLEVSSYQPLPLS